jgi:hypothetical protein
MRVVTSISVMTLSDRCAADGRLPSGKAGQGDRTLQRSDSGRRAVAAVGMGVNGRATIGAEAAPDNRSCRGLRLDAAASEGQPVIAQGLEAELQQEIGHGLIRRQRLGIAENARSDTRPRRSGRRPD